jgi:hypothetical protein
VCSTHVVPTGMVVVALDGPPPVGDGSQASDASGVVVEGADVGGAVVGGTVVGGAASAPAVSPGDDALVGVP